MENRFGITEEGLQVALKIKRHYKSGQPICLPGERDDILIPEHLLNDNLDLLGFEDPLPLAMVASRDPEPPMAMAAAARLSPRARRTELVTEVFDLLGEITKHNEVKHCVELVSANAFSPQAIAEVRRRTSRVIVNTRQQYTAALRQNMKDLMDGAVAPRQFVKEFFRLTEAGNLRNDIRKKLVLSLLLSDTIRPSVKFLFLENFDRFPNPVHHYVRPRRQADPPRRAHQGGAEVDRGPGPPLFSTSLNSFVPESPRYVTERLPESGETITVAPGVEWLRMPLPFRLNHINLWLLEDGDGWTIVDTGIALDNVKEAWKKVFATHFTKRPLKRVIVTHFHPDHMGLAGWLTERFGVELWATLGEWACGRMISLDTGEAVLKILRRFYHAAGFGPDGMALVEKRRDRYAKQVSPIPARHRRIDDGETIEIGGRAWRVIVGSGHSPEHACLHCAELGVLISGDQILPRISPNVSVWPQEPEANPLRRYLDSLELFRGLPAEVLVLPSHDTPFTGLEGRLDQLAHHHDGRLDETLAACAEPSTAVEVLGRLFKRRLDDHELFFAIGESLAHLHFLMAGGGIERRRRDDGVHLFQRTDASTAS